MSDVKYRPPANKPFQVQALPAVRFQGVPPGSPLAQELYRQHAATIHWFHQRAAQAHHAGITDYTKLRTSVDGLDMQYANISGQEIINIRQAAVEPEPPPEKPQPEQKLYPVSANIAVEIQRRSWPVLDGGAIVTQTPGSAPWSEDDFTMEGLPTTMRVRTGFVEGGWRSTDSWSVVPGAPMPIAPLELVLRFPGLSAEQMATVIDQAPVIQDPRQITDPVAALFGAIPYIDISGAYKQPDNGTPWIEFSTKTIATPSQEPTYFALRFNIDFGHRLTPAVTTIELRGGHSWVAEDYYEVHTGWRHQTGALYCPQGVGGIHDHETATVSSHVVSCAPTAGLILSNTMWSTEQHHRMWMINNDVYEFESQLFAANPGRTLVEAARRDGPTAVIGGFSAGTLVTDYRMWVSPLGVVGTEFLVRAPDFYPLLGTLKIDKVSGAVSWASGSAPASFSGSDGPTDVEAILVVFG